MVSATRRAALVAAAFALVTTGLTATPSPAQTASALADGKADGTLTVNGKATKVAFAYARSVADPFDSAAKDTLVIVSDVAIDAKALGDEFARIQLGDKGKIHAFEITVDATGKPISTVWRHNGFKGPAPSGLSTADVFTAATLDDKTVDGAYKSAAPGEFFGSTYAFDVRFRAAIAH